MGAFIHINPDQPSQRLAKMFGYSRKYILMGEFFNRTPISMEHQGENEKTI